MVLCDLLSSATKYLIIYSHPKACVMMRVNHSFVFSRPSIIPFQPSFALLKNFRITSDLSLKRKRYNSISHTSVGMLRHHFIILLYYYIVVVLRIVHICVVSAWLKLVKGVICVVVLLCLTNIFTPCPTIGNNWLPRKSSFIRWSQSKYAQKNDDGWMCYHPLPHGTLCKLF